MTRKASDARAFAALAAAGLLACSGAAHGAAWEPSKPVEIIVPAGAGGASDQMARLISSIVSKHQLMGFGELQGVLAVAGRAVTLELLLEGRIFDAAEACGKGLVNRVVPDAEVEREAFATAERIAAGAPLVARWHKQFIERLTTRANVSPEEWEEAFACFDTEDFREGLDAFIGKRKPRFAGN